MVVVPAWKSSLLILLWPLVGVNVRPGLAVTSGSDFSAVSRLGKPCFEGGA